MKDFHTKFTRRRTLRAISERQRVTLDVIQRKAFRLLRNEPRIFRETASNSMLNAKTYTYLVPGFLPCPSSSISDGVKAGLISASCRSKHPSSPYINIISTPTGQDIR
ncbi:uncharacterized protein LOC135098726 isoform X2 [Scylla paramamosain]|uniref:uncharacterized protein LOC135098726 isoform X2 n=1 Tax=Scylla paramamosain TaxID=85552 RepID=UPI0030831074